MEGKCPFIFLVVKFKIKKMHSKKQLIIYDNSYF